MIETVIAVIAVAIIGAACFYSGWRSAAAYLSAARAVSDVSAAAVQQGNEYVASAEKFTAALDKWSTEVASLRQAVEQGADANRDRYHAVETAMVAIFEGFERSGLVRHPSKRPRQVGEPPETGEE